MLSNVLSNVPWQVTPAGASLHIESCIESCVRGYYIYQGIWNADMEETLNCDRERGN